MIQEDLDLIDEKYPPSTTPEWDELSLDEVLSVELLLEKRIENRRENTSLGAIKQLNELQRVVEEQNGVRAVELLDEYNTDGWNGIQGLEQ